LRIDKSYTTNYVCHINSGNTAKMKSKISKQVEKKTNLDQIVLNMLTLYPCKLKMHAK